MKKRKSWGLMPDVRGIVFQPALTPLEAAVLPARERRQKRRYGSLAMVPHAWEAGEKKDQRAKIWVR